MRRIGLLSLFLLIHTLYINIYPLLHYTHTHTRARARRQTLLEAVLFQANMRLDVNISPEEKLARASALILRAGLQGKEHQSVGGTLPGGIGVRGLSGGEKRRLSLVCATVAGPAILFADEVTSGMYLLCCVCVCVCVCVCEGGDGEKED